MGRNRFIIGFLILCSLFSILPLFQPGFFVTDDGEWMIIRLSAFYQALHDGQFPVRFLHRLNFDYGYPVATFLYPGFLYAGVFFHVLKVGFVETIKLLLGISLIGSTVFTYFWLSRLFAKKSAAVLGALVSLYFPYHFYDVYTRGSVGEIFALMWVPFILWMIERKNGFFLSIGISMLILSHNTMALLFLPVLGLYAILRKTFPYKQILLYFTLGVTLSAFFILPVFTEISLTNFSQTAISDPTKYFADGKLVGFSTYIIFLIAFIFILTKKNFSKGYKSLVLLFLSLTVITLFLTSSLSTSLWQIIPATFIQFPFRLLSYLLIALAFLTAFIVSEVNTLWKKTLVIGGISLLCIISSYSFLMPKSTFNKGNDYYATNDATTTVKDEYMPVWVKEKPLQRAEDKVEIKNGEGKIQNLIYNSKRITFSATIQKTAHITINTIYWPGWKVVVDTKEIQFYYQNPKGVIEFSLPKGEHQVRVEFFETPLRLVSDGISVISFVILLYLLKENYKKRK